MNAPRPAVLVTQSWAGRLEEPVTVVGETPKRWRVRNDGLCSIRLAGRCRVLAPGETVLVPRRAVRFVGGGA